MGPSVLPSLGRAGVWFIDEMAPLIRDWFALVFGFESEDVEEPGEVESTTEDMSYTEAKAPVGKGADNVPEGPSYDFSGGAHRSAGSMTVPSGLKENCNRDGNPNPNSCTGMKANREEISSPTEYHDPKVMNNGKVATTVQAAPNTNPDPACPSPLTPTGCSRTLR